LGAGENGGGGGWDGGGLPDDISPLYLAGLRVSSHGRFAARRGSHPILITSRWPIL